jgi:hypothetical protein
VDTPSLIWPSNDLSVQRKVGLSPPLNRPLKPDFCGVTYSSLCFNSGVSTFSPSRVEMAANEAPTSSAPAFTLGSHPALTQPTLRRCGRHLHDMLCKLTSKQPLPPSAFIQTSFAVLSTLYCTPNLLPIHRTTTPRLPPSKKHNSLPVFRSRLKANILLHNICTTPITKNFGITLFQCGNRSES